MMATLILYVQADQIIRRQQLKIFPVEKMKENIDFAEKTSFDEIYLWGVEWWYFMKQKGNPQYWEYAKSLI